MKILKIIINNYLTVFVALFIIVILGAKAYVSMPREVFPDIKVPYIFVSTSFLGASPKDVENLVTNEIENKLKNIKGLEKIRSISQDSFSSLFLEFAPEINVETALTKVKERVDMAKVNLPKDIESPMVTEFSFEDLPFIYVNLYGDLDLVKLKYIADQLQDELEKIESVLEVNVIGGQEREIKIIISPEQLSAKGLSYNDIARAIQAENINIPGGNLKIGKANYSLRIPGEFTKVSEIEKIVIKTAKGTPIYLKDIASVVDDYKDKETRSRFNGQTSISISLTKKSGANLLNVSEEVKKVTDKFVKKQKFSGFKVDFLNDQSIQIRALVEDLENSAITGFFLVILVLFMFLGFRNSVMVSLAIPFSMLISFIFLGYLGVTLNFIVLFSLILVLGMLVDDAIVVVENIYRHLEEKIPLKEAIVAATTEVTLPVITSTLTTLAAFLPLLFWQGMIGKFMWFLPLTVIITLTSSLFVALFINPVIGSKFMNLSRLKNNEPIADSWLKKKYENILRFCLKYSGLTILFVLGILIFTVIIYGKIGKGVIFFPSTTPSQGSININLPPSTILEDTDNFTKQIAKNLYQYEDLKNFSENIGSQSGGFSVNKSSPNKAQIVLDLKRRSTDVIGPNFDPAGTLKKIRELTKNIPGAQIEVTEPRTGPSHGNPIAIRIAGEDFITLLKLSLELQEELKKVPGLINIKDDYEEGQTEMVVNLDRDKMAILGLNTVIVAPAIRTAVYGNKISSFRDKKTGEQFDITIYYPEKNRKSIEDLENIYITNMMGNNIPLKLVSKIDFSEGISYIQHREFERVIEVSADVEKGFNANTIRNSLNKTLLAKININDGYSISFTGEAEDQRKASSFLSNAFLLTIFLIFMILIAQFNSLFIPIIILSTIILSLIGVLWGLIVTGTAFCVVMTGIGIMSLAGVVVKNGILLLDFTVRLKKQGITRVEALIQAGKIRTRPVLLTAVTSILGLLPMSAGVSINFHTLSIVTKSESSELWMYMSNAVISGLAVATILTLIVVPCAYNLIDSTKEKLGKLFQKSSAS